MSVLGRWRTLQALEWRERWRLVFLALQLLVARLLLHWFPLRRVQSGLRRLPARRRAGAGQPDPHRLAELIHLSARAVPWRANCLHRSLVLWWLLERRAVPGELWLGVRRDVVRERPDFHAWVELAGEVLNDRTDIRDDYAALTSAAGGEGR